ncbi:MAG: transporter [Anaerolineaceae bacterium]|nr:transporter [Anaerolineaceae bacterium]
MAESVYKIIELVGTSTESWEAAAKSLDDIRIAEITKLDMRVDNGQVVAYRARVNVSFKLRD